VLVSCNLVYYDELAKRFVYDRAAVLRRCAQPLGCSSASQLTRRGGALGCT
jgi:hypothetical protein